jgi:hypothetical protein
MGLPFRLAAGRVPHHSQCKLPPPRTARALQGGRPVPALSQHAFPAHRSAKLHRVCLGAALQARSKSR